MCPRFETPLMAPPHTYAHHFEGRVVPDDVTYMSTKPWKCMAAVTQNETLATQKNKKCKDIETTKYKHNKANMSPHEKFATNKLK